jgi:hypothetical protein
MQARWLRARSAAPKTFLCVPAMLASMATASIAQRAVPAMPTRLLPLARPVAPQTLQSVRAMLATTGTDIPAPNACRAPATPRPFSARARPPSMSRLARATPASTETAAPVCHAGAATLTRLYRHASPTASSTPLCASVTWVTTGMAARVRCARPPTGAPPPFQPHVRFTSPGTAWRQSPRPRRPSFRPKSPMLYRAASSQRPSQSGSTAARQARPASATDRRAGFCARQMFRSSPPRASCSLLFPVSPDPPIGPHPQ